MDKARVRVSLVIPAFNEECHLAACLRAVAAQTVKPFEVIVVDNASTDNTAAVARQFDFVRVVYEPRRGVVHARNAGFNAARGDVIGRIDVDTLLCSTWIAELQRVFADSAVDAVSGGVTFYDVPFQSLFASVDSFFRHYLAHNLARRQELFLYGGNMAMRREIWRRIRAYTCQNPAFHEDIDLAAHCAHASYNLLFHDAPELRVAVSARRIDSRVAAYYTYVFANSRTYAAHGLKGRFYMYPVELLVLAFYLPLRVLYRSYNPVTHRFSLAAVFRHTTARISPVEATPSGRLHM